MCIIVAKPKGVILPTKKTLQNCFNNNDDGCGFMYVEKGRVVIDKGYMDFGKFYKALKELKKKFNSDLTDMPLVFHFRIGTAGKNSPQNTHPYPITMDVDKMKRLHLSTDLGIAHNGIIYDYNPKSDTDKGLDMNDTQCFIRDYIAEFKNLNPGFYRNDFVKKQILEESCDNKFTILDGKGEITIIGKFENVDGIYYSNSSYEPDYYYYNYTYGYDSVGTSISNTPETPYSKNEMIVRDALGLGNGMDKESNLDDMLSMSEVEVWDAIDREELKIIDNNFVEKYCVGGAWGYQELDIDKTYVMDTDNNIYLLDEHSYHLTLAWEYEDGRNTLFDKYHQEVDFYEL